MKLLKIQRTDAFVRFSHETNGPTIRANDPKNPGKVIEKVSNEARVVTAHETPLKSFDDAFQALADVVANILETGQDWKKGVTILCLSLSYTKAGIRTAVISFSKKLDATGTAHQLDTPGFQIDDGQTKEEGRMQCAKKHAGMVALMIAEAEKYAEGERQQIMLKFDKRDGQDGPTEPTEGDVLDFKDAPDEPAASAAPKAARPAKPAKKPRGAVRVPARN